MLKWTVRTIVVLVGLAVVAFVVSFVNFCLWRSAIIEGLETDPDRHIAITAQGPIEYAVVGDGVPVLALHGSPGGYDQSLVNRRAVPEISTIDIKIIAVSRPGTLGTPLRSGPTYEQQADLFAALLDELGIERVVVSAASGGGRSALQFALRHPDRTLGLVLNSTGTRRDFDESSELGDAELFFADMVMWAAFKLFPSAWLTDFDGDDPAQVALADALPATIVPLNRRWAGNINDMRLSQDPAIDSWPLERIYAPTLIMHGDADTLVPYADAEYAATRIPDATLITFEGGGHFVYLTKAREAAAHVGEFIRSVTANL